MVDIASPAANGKAQYQANEHSTTRYVRGAPTHDTASKPS